MESVVDLTALAPFALSFVTARDASRQCTLARILVACRSPGQQAIGMRKEIEPQQTQKFQKFAASVIYRCACKYHKYDRSEIPRFSRISREKFPPGIFAPGADWENQMRMRECIVRSAGYYGVPFTCKWNSEWKDEWKDEWNDDEPERNRISQYIGNDEWNDDESERIRISQYIEGLIEGRQPARTQWVNTFIKTLDPDFYGADPVFIVMAFAHLAGMIADQNLADILIAHLDENIIPFATGLACGNHVQELAQIIASKPTWIDYEGCCLSAMRNGARDALKMLCDSAPDYVIDFPNGERCPVDCILEASDAVCLEIILARTIENECPSRTFRGSILDDALSGAINSGDWKSDWDPRSYANLISFARDDVFTFLCDDARYNCGIRDVNSDVSTKMLTFVANISDAYPRLRARIDARWMYIFSKQK